MRSTDLAELSAFGAVARHKSFTRAAKEREVTASAISHAVSNLENRLGVRLLNRTTRNVSLTDAGEMLHASLAPAFAEAFPETNPGVKTLFHDIDQSVGGNHFEF